MPDSLQLVCPKTATGKELHASDESRVGKMNHSILFAAVVVLSLHFKSLSSQSQKPYSGSHDADEIFVQSFKTKLLKELGLSSVPNVSAAKVPSLPAISKHFVEAENRKFDQPVDEEDKFHAKTKRIFLFPDQGEAFFLGSRILVSSIK